MEMMELNENSEPTRIIIAEDESIIALDISSILYKIGYNVLSIARTEQDVINKAGELKPNLILMDIMLDNNGSGIKAAEVIKEKFDIPIIYVSALADEETLKQAKITEPFGYIIKPFDAKTLHTSIEMALYRDKISKGLKERTKELEEERIKSNKLLQNIFPSEIIKELRESGSIKPREYKLVTILYTDFQDFTKISTNLTPDDLVNELNDIFMNFDAIIESYGLEKIKTIGDSYMAAGGLPKEDLDHPIKIISAAIEMQDYLKKRNFTNQQIWQMRAGIHSGSVIAGVVGKKKYAYDIWGKSVEIANLMERFGNPGMINISQDTYEIVKDDTMCEINSTVNIPDLGNVHMYWIKDVKKDRIKAAL